MSKASEIRNVRYEYRPSSAFSLEKENSFASLNESSQTQKHIYATVKSSKSPHFSKLVIALVVAGVVAVGVITALVVVLAKTGSEEETTTAPPVQEAVSTVQSQITTEAVAVQTTNTTNTDAIDGTWSQWGAWTKCTATCNSGIHKRYRQCIGEDSSKCLGDFVETEICLEASCPSYGKWTTWGQWGSCDVTCGGGSRSRTRTCTKIDSSDLDCVGTNSQNNLCSDWECPDCSRICTVGTLNTDCDTCICEGTTITGRVLANITGYPLSNAALYANSAPTKLLTMTNSTGFFTLNATCLSSELHVIRQGFVDEIFIANNFNLEVRMATLVMPYLTETPQSKYRLFGENVTLCCEAVANPPVSYFEWFKDGNILDTELYPNGNRLTLTSLTNASIGIYQCRANSPAGAIMSPSATLTVKEISEDFCADALQPKTITLPDDCVQTPTNTATYDVGECVSKKCRQNGSLDNGMCRKEVSSCCMTGEANLETVQCSGYELEIIVVRSCTCSACASSSLRISGTALSFEDRSPLKYGEVWANGEFQGYTSLSGDFSFQVSKISSKITITLKDNYFRHFLQAIKVIDISDDLSGVLHVDIMMIKAVEPVEIDSSIENTLVAGALADNAAEPVVQISLPANAFYYPDGTQYNGTVEASLTYLDPTNSSILGNIPGVFQFVDEEGQTGNLASLAVFNLYFEDKAGNQLVLDEVVDLFVSEALAGSVANQDIKLWKLNTETGVWEYVTPGTGTRRRKRQNTPGWIGEIDLAAVTDQTWWNYDRVYDLTENPCYFKIRLFKDKELTEAIPNPGRRINVDYTILSGNTMITVRDYFRYPEDDCIIGICENDTAYISLFYKGFYGYDALYAGEPLIKSNISYNITDGDKVLKTGMSISEDGPFYEKETQCLISNAKNFHLRYHYGKQDKSYIYNEIPPSDQIDPKLLFYISQRTWYPSRDEGIRVCYIKVRLTFENNLQLSPGQYMKIKVTSFGGTYSEVKDFIFGIQDIYVGNETEDSTYCIEYKCSGTIEPDKKIDHTRVVMTLTNPSSDYFSEVTGEADFVSSDPTSLNVAQNGSTNGTYEFYAPLVYSPDLGLYSATKDLDFDSAKNIAKSECKSGKLQILAESNPELGVAVTFNLRKICSQFYVYC